MQVQRRFVNLSENFFAVPLSGSWKDYRTVQVKSRIILETNQVKVSLFFDGELRNGQKQHLPLKFLVFEDPLALEKLGTILIALSNLMQGNLEPDQLKLQAARVVRNTLRYYQLARKTLKEETE